MTNRTVKVELEAGTSRYTPPVREATQATTGLTASQKEAAASLKAGAEAQASSTSATIEASRQTRLLTNAQREAVAASRAAAAADAEATKQLTAAQKEAAAAAKDTSALGGQRRAAAQEALQSAEAEAAASAEVKKAADGQAKAASAALIAHKDQTAAARENAAEETASAKASEAAATKRKDAYTGTSKVALAAGAVLAGAFYEAEKATSDFNKSLSGVQAVSNASAADMDKLRGAALQAGKDTAFTATEAADAEGELVKAGVSVSDVLGGALKGSLSLAAAGQLDLADAATISANAMNTFGLHGSDVSHIADVLAAAANKSAADVKELAYGMQQGGLVAAQTGLTFEDTSAVLAAFADRGLKGADAGTSLKTMLEKLNAPSTQAAGLMEQLGIQTYDASGKFVGITTLAGELKDKMGGLTDAQRNQAMATIFGSDAIRAASVLFNLGADGVKGYKDAVNDSGAASRMADEQMNNLSGDLKQLKGSIDVALIQGGSGANDVLREMAKTATNAVNAFAGLPKPVQEAAVGFAGGGGAALLLVGGMTSIAGKAANTKKVLSEVAEASSGMKGALASAGSFMAGPWGIAAAGAATVIGMLATKHHDAKIEIQSFTDAIKEDGNALGSATTQAVAADLAQKGLLGTYQKLGVSSTTLTDAALGSADALQKVADATMAAIKADGGNLKQTGALAGNLATVKAYKGALDDQLKAQQQATAATENSTAALGQSDAETKNAAKAAKDAAAAAFAQAGAQRSLGDAELMGAQATASATQHRKLAGAAAKEHTAAMRDEAMATDDSAKSEADASAAADKHTAALYKTADSAKAAAEAAAKNKDANADQAKATADAAEAGAEANDVHQSGVKWLRDIADAEISAAGSARDLDSSVTDEVGAMKDAKEKASSLKDALDALNGVHIAASRAAVDVQDKVAGLTKALHENGTTMDITTEKGRTNMSAVLDLASAINQHAQAVTDETGSVEAGDKALDASREQFDKVLRSAGLSADQIDHFNKTLLNTPKLAPVTITADTSSFEATMRRMIDRFGYMQVQVGGGSGGRAAFATGGLVDGVGGPTSDSNMVAVSNREYIVRAAVVARPGMLAVLNDLNFGSGNQTVVKPQIPFHALASAPAGASVGSGAALHVENYFESGAPPQAVAAELGWLLKARGASW